MMELCIDGNNLRKALTEIEAAEANGFDYCLAIFRITQGGSFVSEVIATYSDLLERAHPRNANLDWGRDQGVTKKNKFVDGRLVPIKATRG